MTARPFDPGSRRWPLIAAVALVLLLAMAMAAGCVSPGFNNPIPALPDEKYVFLQQNTDYNPSTISGTCFPVGNVDYGYDYSFNETTGVLTVFPFHAYEKQVNESLLLFYGQSSTEKQGAAGNMGDFLYSVPRQFNGNVTIESVLRDGTVTLRFDDIPIILKPKEHWENSTREIRYTPPFQIPISEKKMPDGSIQIGESSFECTEEIVITKKIYNAGLFDKKSIVLPLPERTPEPAFGISAHQFMNWSASRGKP